MEDIFEEYGGFICVIVFFTSLVAIFASVMDKVLGGVL